MSDVPVYQCIMCDVPVLGMGISFRPLQKKLVSSIARVFDRTARHVFERCVFKLLSPIYGIRSKRNKE